MRWGPSRLQSWPGLSVSHLGELGAASLCMPQGGDSALQPTAQGRHELVFFHGSSGRKHILLWTWKQTGRAQGPHLVMGSAGSGSRAS